MKKNKTLYSKIVALKKRYITKQLVPSRIGHAIDSFFNNLHNVLIQTRDVARDKTRDVLVRTKDLTRDSLIKSKDIARDSIVRSKDITRDSLTRSRDAARDAIEIAKDRTRDLIVQSTDITKDNIEKSKQIAGDAILQSGSTRTKNALLFPFLVVSNIVYSLFETIRLLPYAITEASDQEAVKNLQSIVANSENVRERIKRYYGRTCEVIHPPIDIEHLANREASDYWLSVNRLTPEKRVLEQIEAFNILTKERLVIVGGHDDNHKDYVEDLYGKASYNTQFLGTVSDRELIELYAHCKGFITTALDEDFGMSAVEALASGKPVIAPNEGGYRETIINCKTGILIDTVTAEKITEAVSKIGEILKTEPEKYTAPCRKRAEEFGTDVFSKKMRVAISGLMRSL
ncbi:MAG: glycosyltransferase [Candidatus Paceibacterota bacterium]|jgi:glycosyltransferase involved in cell wall biosynthesis